MKVCISLARPNLRNVRGVNGRCISKIPKIPSSSKIWESKKNHGSQFVLQFLFICYSRLSSWETKEWTKWRLCFSRQNHSSVKSCEALEPNFVCPCNILWLQWQRQVERRLKKCVPHEVHIGEWKFLFGCIKRSYEEIWEHECLTGYTQT